MFKDYYSILEVEFKSSQETIKKSYRNLSMKWHPDKNPNQDVTHIMQDINEAYYIIGNTSRRLIYDSEYQNFIQQRNNNRIKHWTSYANNDSNSNKYKNYYSYDVEDNSLNDLINEARNYAIEYVKKILKETGQLFVESGKAIGNEIITYLVVFVILTLLGFIIRSCS